MRLPGPTNDLCPADALEVILSRPLMKDFKLFRLREVDTYRPVASSAEKLLVGMWRRKPMHLILEKLCNNLYLPF